MVSVSVSMDTPGAVSGFPGVQKETEGPSLQIIRIDVDRDNLDTPIVSNFVVSVTPNSNTAAVSVGLDYSVSSVTTVVPNTVGLGNSIMDASNSVASVSHMHNIDVKVPDAISTDSVLVADTVGTSETTVTNSGQVHHSTSSIMQSVLVGVTP